jgi:hypothetical protein
MFSIVIVTLLVTPVLVSVVAVAMTTAVIRLVACRLKLVLLAHQILREGIIDHFNKVF